VFLHRSGKLLFQLLAITPKADLQIAAYIFTCDTGKHVIVAW
jgi:hypothetical protein